MISYVFYSLGMGFFIIAIAAYLTGRISRTTWNGCNAIGNSLLGVAKWHGGGGDDMKRRLKRCARRFQGVRRTAPQGT
ncbi:hypothetical protein P1P75_33475 [Streptomyces sp. ID05-39B]|uniref:hypothetical protein n=1 Tax=Streptomyces sp. ID05-39B TaxID=3028664 RepID=UPI0029A5579D|nr:hypothetical protein [Streptomyces sp. ID05-39B]MDX3531185.1 hypothetical protein [Streptomyces sp. ID05-39B]